jgi:hypothetical protein
MLPALTRGQVAAAEGMNMRKMIVSLFVLAVVAMCSTTEASARGGGHGGGFHGGGFHGGGFHGGGFHGGFRGGFGGSYGPYYGYGDDYYPYGYEPYSGYDGCYIIRRRVLTHHGWRIRRIRACG